MYKMDILQTKTNRYTLYNYINFYCELTKTIDGKSKASLEQKKRYNKKQRRGKQGRATNTN